MHWFTHIYYLNNCIFLMMRYGKTSCQITQAKNHGHWPWSNMVDCLSLICIMVSHHGLPCPSVTMVKHCHWPWQTWSLKDMVSKPFTVPQWPLSIVFYYDQTLSLIMVKHGWPGLNTVDHDPFSENQMINRWILI